MPADCHHHEHVHVLFRFAPDPCAGDAANLPGSGIDSRKEFFMKKKPYATDVSPKYNRKRFVLMILCGLLLCVTSSGCAKVQHKTRAEEKQVQKNMGSGITGTIAVSNREEKEAADRVVQELFDALEAGDEATIKGLFSTYAQENAVDLDVTTGKLIAYYPGADGGYTGSSRASEANNFGKKQHDLNLTLTVTDKGQEYQIRICLIMKDDYDPSREGIHLIEIIREEEKPSGFKWKMKDAPPGIYVGE